MKRLLRRLLRKLLGVHYRGRHTKAAMRTTPPATTERLMWIPDVADPNAPTPAELARGVDLTRAIHTNCRCPAEPAQPEPAPSNVDGAFSAIVAELPDLAERFRSINSVMGGGTAEEVTPQ